MTDAPKAQSGDWDDQFNRSKEKGDNSSGGSTPGQLPFMKFSESKTYKIRLVGGHVKYLKYWEPINAITHGEYLKEKKDPVRKAGFYYNSRYAIHCIDREDGQLKILDKGNKIFEHFATFKGIHGIDPAGKDAPDFSVIVTIPTGKDGKPKPRRTTYQIEADRDNSPLTKEEITLYKEQKIDLTDKYKSHSLEDIQKLWDALSDEQKIPKKRDDATSDSPATSETPSAPPAAPPAVEEKMDDAPADNADLFGDESAEGETSASELF